MSLETSLFGSMVLCAFLYGIHFCVFASTIYFAHNFRGKRSGKTPAWMYACVWVMFALGTMNMVGNVGLLRKLWIYSIEMRESPAGWKLDNRADPMNVLAKAGVAPSFWIQNAVLIHRMFVIYYNYKHRARLAAAALIGLLATIVIWIVGLYRLFLPVDTPRVVSDFAVTIMHCTFSELLNLAVTIAIIWRMLYLRRYILKALGPDHAKMYTSISAMFVESGAIFSVLMLICNVQLRRKLGLGFESVVYAIMGQATGISTDAIVFRVTWGRAWSSKTMSTPVSESALPGPSEQYSKRNNLPKAEVVIMKDVFTAYDSPRSNSSPI